MANGTVEEALNFYRQRLGMGENPPGSNQNAITQEYGVVGPWCCMTFSLAERHAGVDMPSFAYVPYLKDWFEKNGRIIGAPIAGAAVMYDWDNTGVMDHVGLVESVGGNGSFIALEGNCGDRLGRFQRSIHQGYGVHFGNPPYRSIVNHSQLNTPGLNLVGLYDAPPAPLWKNFGGNDPEKVKHLQMILDYVTGRGLQVDGVFGDATASCLADLQRILQYSLADKSQLPITGQYNDVTQFFLQGLLNQRRPK